MLCLFNISQFSSIACTAAMAKRSQQDSGEERVTAKSRPMMNILHSIVRIDFNFSFLCCHGKAISTRFRRRASHSKIATDDESYFEDAIVRVVFNFSEPGGRDITENKILGSQLLQKIDQGNLIEKQRASLQHML